MFYEIPSIDLWSEKKSLVTILISISQLEIIHVNLV